MTKIAIVDELHNYKKSGMYHSTIATKSMLEKANVEVTIIAIPIHGPLLSKLVCLPYFRDIFIYPIWNFLQRKKIEKNSYDIVFYRNTTSLLLFRKSSFKKIIFTSTLLSRQLKLLLGINIPYYKKLISILLYPLCFATETISLFHADKIIASKNRFKLYIHKYHRIKSCKIEVLPQVIDTSLRPVKTKKLFDLLFIGRMSVPKNWQIIEELAKITNYKILALTPEKQPKNKLYSNIEVRSKVPYEELAGVISAAKIFIMPSHMETGPRVTLEAMACGLPVVASPEGSGDFIENQINGFIVSTNNVDDYIYSIDKILKNSEQYARISKANITKARLYSIDSLAEQYLNTLIS